MTSCMSSKRSNHLGYASEACILYHSILCLSRPKMGFFEANFDKRKGSSYTKKRARLSFCEKSLVSFLELFVYACNKINSAAFGNHIKIIGD